VRGDVELVLIHSSMYDRSYVCPSAQRTGSFMASWEIGQQISAGVDPSSVEAIVQELSSWLEMLLEQELT